MDWWSWHRPGGTGLSRAALGHRCALPAPGGLLGALDTPAVLVRFGLASSVCCRPPWRWAPPCPDEPDPGAQPWRRRRRIVSLAYALNTFGAVAGCWLAGLHLVPSLGQAGTLRIAYALNLVCTLAALPCRARVASLIAERRARGLSPARRRADRGRAGRQCDPSPRSARVFQAVYLAMGGWPSPRGAGLPHPGDLLQRRHGHLHRVGLSVYLAGFALGSGPLYRLVQRLAGPPPGSGACCWPPRARRRRCSCSSRCSGPPGPARGCGRWGRCWILPVGALACWAAGGGLPAAPAGALPGHVLPRRLRAAADRPSRAGPVRSRST